MLWNKRKSNRNRANKSLDAFFDAAYCGDKAKILKSLRRVTDFDIDSPGRFNKTVLEWYILKGEQELAELLLSYGAKPENAIPDMTKINSQDQYGLTYAHRVAYCGITEVGEILVENGADFNIRDEDGHTALDIARKVDHNKFYEAIKQKLKIAN